jgi:hypothetical protein
MTLAYAIEPPSAASFRRQFPEITVELNWRRFEAEGWPVTQRVVSERDKLLQFHTFFRRSLGRVMPHFLHWVASRQMRLEEVLRLYHRIPAEHREIIAHFADQLADGHGTVSLDLPTYQFAGNQHFILDGNHRACAILLSGRPFRITLHSVHGPVERDALVDVVHCR